MRFILLFLISFISVFGNIHADSEPKYVAHIVPKHMSVKEKKERFYYLVVPAVQKVHDQLMKRYRKIAKAIKNKRDLKEVNRLKALYQVPGADGLTQVSGERCDPAATRQVVAEQRYPAECSAIDVVFDGCPPGCARIGQTSAAPPERRVGTTEYALQFRLAPSQSTRRRDGSAERERCNSCVRWRARTRNRHDPSEIPTGVVAFTWMVDTTRRASLLMYRRASLRMKTSISRALPEGRAIQQIAASARKTGLYLGVASNNVRRLGRQEAMANAGTGPARQRGSLS